MKKAKKASRRWVVKAGSQMVCGGGPLLLRAWMNQVSLLRKNHGIEVIWVTSGAIASAVERTEFRPKNGKKRTLPEKQALSALGQPMVMDQYLLALNAAGMIGAQVLLTAGDMREKGRRRNLQNTLETLLNWKAVPILNENDAIATDEIQFGDNDSLSSQIARVMGAERLILLTDVDGLYDSDPRTNPKAALIPYRAKVTPRDLKYAGKNSGSGKGTGGMFSKLLAAREAAKDGIVTHLVRGDWPQNLVLLAKGNSIGTQIGGRYV
ncbi:MAG TPA: glutamate 5-kinase [Bdellovibrionales bacterium]|nr:glutamate 5-kinase [Bdellovibrionales bacterium]